MLFEEIVVVSGLPRSGTSMMMNILNIAGIPVITDGKRKPDKDNPNGYYEFEMVKEFSKKSVWIEDCKGKAVKIISFFLTSLPDGLNYKVIFMNRCMEEIIGSQGKMLERNKKIKNIPDKKLMRIYYTHLSNVKSYLFRKPNTQFLNLNYNHLLDNPIGSVELLINFLNIKTSEDIKNEMIKVIDPKLYRNKVL